MEVLQVKTEVLEVNMEILEAKMEIVQVEWKSGGSFHFVLHNFQKFHFDFSVWKLRRTLVYVSV
ncbi:MAG: hypothetical protein ABJC87_18785 [Roseobacter sp.]